MTERREGAFIPKEMLESWETLRVDGSTWNVLIAIALQQYRYGGNEAKITQPTVAKRTERSLSTVKRSVQKLCDIGLLEKLGRGRWRLIRVNTVTPICKRNTKRKGVNTVTPSKGHRVDTYPTLLFSLLKNKSNEAALSVFTPKQRRLISDLISEISELLGHDALGLPTKRGDRNISFREWGQEIVRASDKIGARNFVKALLLLRKDERVVGTELTVE